MAEKPGGGPDQKVALEQRATAGERLFSPSAARNCDPIRAVFLKYMPESGKILEVGSGTGEHAVHLAASLPNAEWRAGDPDPASQTSIAAWIAHAGLSNLKGPHAIDVTSPDWGGEDDAPFAAIVSINMIHIAPFAAAEGIVAGAGRLLANDGKLFFYGPFSRNGAHTAPSNAEFDRTLRERNPAWGVRDLDRDILPLAQKAELSLEHVVEMPANNLSVIFKKH